MNTKLYLQVSRKANLKDTFISPHKTGGGRDYSGQRVALVRENENKTFFFLTMGGGDFEKHTINNNVGVSLHILIV